MPALPPVPSVLRARLFFLTGPATKCGIRLYYLYSGTAPSNATCAAIASDIRAAFSTDLAGLMSDDFDLAEVEVTDLSSATGGQGSDTTLVNGTRAGNPPMIDSAVNLGFTIARRYRGGKPKTFLPFGIQSDVSTTVYSEWTTGFQSGVNSDWTNFDTAVLAISTGGTAVTQHVSVSYYEGFTAAQNPVTGRWRNIPKLRAAPVVDVITGHEANLEISQQRRRRTSTS